VKNQPNLSKLVAIFFACINQCDSVNYHRCSTPCSILYPSQSGWWFFRKHISRQNVSIILVSAYWFICRIQFLWIGWWYLLNRKENVFSVRLDIFLWLNCQFVWVSRYVHLHKFFLFCFLHRSNLYFLISPTSSIFFKNN
jgi:hypothetical protein